MSLCIVYNTCGINGGDNFHYYYQAINSILHQSFKDYKLVVSGCCLPPIVKSKFRQCFPGALDLHLIDEIYPVTVTFNHAVLTAIDKYGPFEGYLYIDSGCSFKELDDLQKLYDGFKSGNYGMYAARTDEDTGYFDWFGIGANQFDTSQDDKLFNGQDFVIPLGKTCNLHGQIFSHKLVEAYSRPYVDIFAGHCSESVFTFCCAAIKTKMAICKDVILHHVRLDGQSAGFKPWHWEASGRKRSDHPYLIPSVLDVCCSKEAKECGLGYEELQGIAIHDPNQFDVNGYCVNSELKAYIRKNLYLSDTHLNYKDINWQI